LIAGLMAPSARTTTDARRVCWATTGLNAAQARLVRTAEDIAAAVWLGGLLRRECERDGLCGAA
jgi:hypothetical protein